MRKILKNLKIWQQLLIVSILFAVPIVVLLYFLISSHNQSISMTEREIKGQKYLEPLQNIMALLPKYQCYTLSSKICNSSEKIEIDKISLQIDSSLNIILNSMSEYSADLKITEQDLIALHKENIDPNNILKLWKNYKSSFGTADLLEFESKFNELYNTIHSLNRHIADEGNLILDPDLDSYYMMDISVLVMPQIYKQITDAIHLCAKVAESDSAKLSNIGIFKYYSIVLEQDLINRINYGVKVALRMDAEYYGLSSGLQNEIPKELETYKPYLEDYIRNLNSISLDTSHSIVPTIKASTLKVLSTGANFWKKISAELLVLLNARLDDYKEKKSNALIISILLAFIALILIFFISYRISRALIHLRKISDSIANGDMAKANENLLLAKEKGYLFDNSKNKEYKIRDELFILFHRINTMTINLDSLLNKIKTAASRVGDSTIQISTSARDLETTVAEQAASTNEVNATSREISANSSELASTMDNVSNMASEAADIVDFGVKGLAEINSTMSALISSAKVITDKLHIIKDKSENITQVIETITKVANQTNLLSLNAAIEAEKAGKFGMGFSVVAQEIRRLADQTSVAALDIEEMIKEMQVAVNEGVTVVENYSVETKQSSEKTANISGNIANAIDQIRKLEPELEAMNQGMQMQSEAAGQIKEAMEQLNIVAIQTRDALVEFNKATDQLNEVVGVMNEEMTKFIFVK